MKDFSYDRECPVQD